MKQRIKRSCFRLKHLAVSLFSVLCFGAAWGAVQTAPIPDYPGAGYVRTGLGELGDEVAVVFTNTVEGAYYTAPGDLKNVQFLVVGGGGGGGGHYYYSLDKKQHQGGAGGGGGGVVTGILPTISSGVAFTAVVGAGGSGGEATTTAEALQGAAENGGNSSFSITNVTYITAYGGGGDGGYCSPGIAIGGSNSGARGDNDDDAAADPLPAAELLELDCVGEGAKAKVSDVVCYRNKGGTGYVTNSGAPGAGGGGAGSPGIDSWGSSLGGYGGNGYETDFTGVVTTYGSGGGGGTGKDDDSGKQISEGGDGAGWGVGKKAGTAAVANQGGGGGGGSYLCAGGAGGSGIVAFRFIYFEGSIQVDPEDNILTKISDKYYTGDVLSSGIVSTPAYTVEELGERIHADEYKVQVTLNDEYVWSDGFENKAREFSWKIMQEPNEWATAPSLSHTAWPQAQAQNIKFTAPKAKYGTLSTPTICKNGGEAEVFSGKLPTEPGTYTIKYEVIGNDDYAGRVWEQTFTIYRSTPIDGGYKVFGLGENKNEIAVAFTQNANWEVPKNLSNVEFLVVGGGGGGGADLKGNPQNGGGGGGGGGVVTGFVDDLAAEDVISITIGSGGTAAKANDSWSSGTRAGGNGGDSIFYVNNNTYVTAYGGGGSGGYKKGGAAGGSSGGSRPGYSSGGATKGKVHVSSNVSGTKMWGNKGGNGKSYSSGGGGGATEVGGPASDNNRGGDGGEGLLNDITGADSVYGSGGGGGAATHGYTGGYGGTGAGDSSTPERGSYNGASALDNQGGGGGGSGREGNGGKGGSGIVAFRYVSTPIDNIIFRDEFEAEINSAISGQQFVYNGESQSALPDVFLNSAKYTIASNITATAAGTYTFTITPNEGYSWDDESLESKEFTWTIHPIDPSAGYVKEIGDEVVVAFTNHKAVATWVVPEKLRNVQFLVVGGGGGGGAENGGTDDRQGGAGGGGGSVVTGIVTKLESGSELSIKVGAGGGCGKSKTKYSSKDNNSCGASGSGGASYIKVGDATYVNAPGGGGDGGSEWNSISGAKGKTGGSSGGSRPGCSTVTAVTDATVDKNTVACYKAYGNTGGAGWTGGKYYGLYAAAGGGGGAETAGYSPTGNNKAGDGGEGLICSITGESVVYGSGGGGATLNGHGGGIGGEGAGDGNTEERGTDSGEDALPNQGGGGGGAARNGNGGNGGSGIVVFRYSKVQYVAQIGEDMYETLQAAVDAAVEGNNTIQLIGNVEIDAAIQIAKTVIIDLNGFTVATTENDTVGDGVFCVTAGVLTINDSVGTGVVKGVGGNSYNIAVWANGGKVIVNGGTFTNVGATDSSGDNTHFDLIYAKIGGSVEINGGTFIAETPAWTLNIHDGSRNTSSIKVKGGTFYNFNPEDCASEGEGTNFCAPGYMAKPVEGDGVTTYTVSGPYDAKIAYVGYATFAAALTAAEAGDTITLLRDITASDAILVDKSITIDGNGKTLTSSATRAIRLTTAGTNVTIEDLNVVSTVNGSSTQDVRGISIDNVGNITLTLNGCTVDFTAADAYAYAVNISGGTGSTLTINGGTYEGVNVINVWGTHTVAIDDATLTSIHPLNTADAGACVRFEAVSTATIKNTIFNGANAVAISDKTGTSTITEEANTDNTKRHVAKVNGTYYNDLTEAITAANGETVVLLASGELAQPVAANFDLNGWTLKGTFAGTLIMNGGKYYSADNHYMAGPKGYYATTDATFVLGQTAIEIAAGNVSISKDMNTLPGQTLTIAAGANFTVPVGMTINVLNSTIIVNGTLTINGTLKLGGTYEGTTYTAGSITAPEGLTVTPGVEGYNVLYAEGKYTLVAAAGKWDAVIADGVTGVTADNKANVETKLDALAKALGAAVDAEASTVTDYFAKAYGTAVTVKADALLGANAETLEVSAAYDLPLMAELPDVTVAKATADGALAFEFTLAGVTIAGSADNAVKLVKYSATVNSTYAYDGDKMTVTVVDGKLKAVFNGTDTQGFAKVDFTVPNPGTN